MTVKKSIPAKRTWGMDRSAKKIYNYVMNESSPPLSTRVVYAFIPDPSPFTTARLVRGIASRLNEVGGLRMVLTRHRVADMLRHAGRDPTAGIISYTTTERDASRLVASKRETVNLFGDIDERIMPSVRVDDVEVGRSGARHLMELGLDCLAFAGLHFAWSDDRREGFVEELAARGRKAEVFRPARRAGRAAYPDDGSASLRRWVASLGRPCGVLACCDVLGAAIIRVAQDLGRSVPGDLAVLGVDNTELHCEHAPVPMSSVDPGQGRMGYEAASLLLQRLDDPASADWTRVVPPRGVVVRQSTDVLAIRDPDLHRAVRFVRDFACEGIAIEDVLAEVPVSRRQLERRFARQFGHSLGEEIRRCRLERARCLLIETNLPLPAIAVRCGFEYPSYLSRAVKRRFGLSPRDLRASAWRGVGK